MTEVSNINNLGIVFIFIMVVLILYSPRETAIVPIIITACYMTLGQMIVVASLNFTLLRIIILFAWIRIILRREYSYLKLNTIDKLLLVWIIVRTISYTILFQTVGALVNRLGHAYYAIGLYFYFRCIVRNEKDIIRTIKIIAMIIVPLSLIMLFEKISARNIFYIFGGVPENTVIRGGRLRCQGPFRHPILAGTVGATLMPLMIALWFQGIRYKVIAFSGLVAVTILTITSASSGPVTVYACAVLALFMWPFRKYMRTIRFGILFSVIALDVVMKARVWFLIGRLSSIVGGTGYHRSILIDQAIEHFGDYWMFGTNYTANWEIATILENNPNMVDITNQYISEAVNGGFVSLVLFLSIITISFREIGRALRMLDYRQKEFKIFLWSVGVSLFAHIMSFLSVSYFDQMILFWYLLLAVIATISNQSKSKNFNNGFINSKPLIKGL